MSLVLEREAPFARWRRGPDPAALATILGERAERVNLARVHFPGGRPVQLVYAARLRSGIEVPILAEHIPVDAAAHAARTTASLRKSRNGQRGALAHAPVVADDASNLVLRRPGLDERLPGLRLLHDGTFAREVVARLTGRDPGPVSTRLMAHRLGKRAVIRIDAPGQRIYTRIRALKSRDGETRLGRHLAVWKALRPDLPLRIPEPLGALPELGLSLFGELPGHPPHAARDHDAIARALSALRGFDLAGLPVHVGADEASLLRDWHHRCRVHGLGLAATIGPIVERTCQDLTETAEPARPCHRDLHEKQILVGDGGAGFLDFDTLSLASASLDPGNLLAHVFMAHEDERPLARAFSMPGLALWRRAALLRLAMIHAFTSTPDAAIRRLIQEAAR